MNWFHRRVCRSDRWRSRLATDLLPWALRGVELGEEMLEVGPGPGVTTDLLRSRGCRLTVLEIEQKSAEDLHHRLAGTGVRVVHGNGADMPFTDASFSAVVAFTVLHHVPTPGLQDRLFSEAHRVLRPGGVLAGFDGSASFLFRLIHLRDTYTPVDPETLGRRLEAAGFLKPHIDRARGRFRFSANRV